MPQLTIAPELGEVCRPVAAWLDGAAKASMVPVANWAEGRRAFAGRFALRAGRAARHHEPGEAFVKGFMHRQHR